MFLSAAAFSLRRSSTESLPSLGQHQSGTNLRIKLTKKLEKPIPKEMSHCHPHKPSGLVWKTRFPKHVIKTCAPRITNQSTQKVGFLVMS